MTDGAEQSADDDWSNVTVSVVSRPPVELVIGTFTYLVILLMTVFGNSLVVVSVFNYRPLKKVQNYFLVSLAAADVAVSTLVMPFHIVKFLVGDQWLFGLIVCQMWLTFDILCCTASILNLVAIALDRYWAITQPLEYAQKRTLKRVTMMIAGVWCTSALIAIPPLIGFNDWDTIELRNRCELNSDTIFVVFSASGSFFVPLTVMATVYVKIFLAARKRLRTNRDRSAIGKMHEKQPQSTPLLGTVEVHARLNEMTETVLMRPVTAAASSFATAECSIAVTEHESPSIEHDLKSRTVRSDVDVVVAVWYISSVNGFGQTATGRRLQASRKAIANNYVTSRLVAASSFATAECSVAVSQHESPSIEHDLKSRTKFTAGSRSGGAGVLRPANTTSSAAVLPSAQSMVKRKEKISVSKEKKAAKTLAVIMGVFVLCWLPFFLMYLIMPFCGGCHIHPKVVQAVTWLGYINSAINPVIYTIFNMDFRRAFERYLCPAKVRQRQRFSRV